MIDDVLIELKKFSTEVVELFEPMDNSTIKDFENRHRVVLPDEYKKILLFSNGLSVRGSELLPLVSKRTKNTVEEIYRIIKEVLPSNFLPVSPDGAGNYYCLSLATLKGGSCEVTFWQSDYEYSDLDLPEVVNASFSEFIKEVFIDWTLQDYDFNGNKK